MGQARQRGTRAERVALAVRREALREEARLAAREARAAREKARREAAERERIARMSPEELRQHNEDVHRLRMRMAEACGVVYGIMSGPAKRPGDASRGDPGRRR